MPFVKHSKNKNSRQGSRLVTSRLSNGKVTRKFKAYERPEESSSSQLEVPNEVAVDTGAVEFDVEEHNAAEFLLTGEVVKKKSRYEESNGKGVRALEYWF